MKKVIFCFSLIAMLYAQASVITQIINRSPYIVQLATTQPSHDTPITINPGTKIIFERPCSIPCCGIFNDIETEAPDYLEICLCTLAPHHTNKKFETFLSYLMTEGKLKSYAFNNKALYAIWLQKRMVYNHEDNITIQHIAIAQEEQTFKTYTLLIDQTASLHIVLNNQ
jgi:hypothetical protein